jgi:PhzF family phenazine biosynthesis protein
MQPIVVVDAFTDQPFAGNPAAVCVLDREADEGWMRAVAREMNLSETAFLVRRPDGFGLRWLTPAVEVDLCGHATLASAHVLWDEGHVPRTEDLRFETRSGVLTACVDRDDPTLIVLDFPATRVAPAEPPAELLDALSVQPLFTGRSRFDYLLEIESEEAVWALTPDHPRLRQLPVRGVMVTAKCERPGVDFVSRFFAPGSGVDEDPVTGSAHCALGPYWAEKLGRDVLHAEQISARGGKLRVTCSGDRVELAGRAVTVWRGNLLAGAAGC